MCIFPFTLPYIFFLFPFKARSGGPPQQLLCLVGTIPIVFNSVTYNIPIIAWVVDNYPYAPPVVYVNPTPDILTS